MSNGKIVVMGGDGFIGSEICRLAAETRYDVVSISRSGKPRKTFSWHNAVQWVAADVFEPETWKHHLKGAEAVIHTIGILWEKPNRGITYDRVNGESAVVASRTAAEAQVRAFVFISAAQTLRLLPNAYFDAKKRAEEVIQNSNAHWAVLRPALVYGWQRPWWVLPGTLLRRTHHLPLVGKRLGELLPLPVEVVATAALRAAVEPNIGGILDVEMIERIGRSLLKDWRPQPITKVA